MSDRDRSSPSLTDTPLKTYIGRHDDDYPLINGNGEEEDEIIEVYNDTQLEPTEQDAGPPLLIPNGPETTPLPTPTSQTAPVQPPQVVPLASAVVVPDVRPGPSTMVNPDNAQVTPIQDDTVPSLDPEILQLLGEDPADQKNYGETLHKDVASRWAFILSNGLNRDTQLELMKCYLPPENCLNMRAPKLNLEIKAALLDTNIKKDLYSQSKQNQLASSLAAIGKVLNWALSSNNTVPQDIIKSLSDAGRLICDSHYKESQSRRYAALSTLNKNIRDTVKNTNIDEHLFGSSLSDHIKSSKAINKTGSEIKQKAPRPTYRALATTQPRVALNSRGAPPRLAAAVEPRTTPAPRRPPRDRRLLESSRGRRPTNNARPQARRR